MADHVAGAPPSAHVVRSRTAQARASVRSAGSGSGGRRGGVVATCSMTRERLGSCSPRCASTQRKQAVAPGYDVGAEHRAAGTLSDQQVRRTGPHPVVEPPTRWLALAPDHRHRRLRGRSREAEAGLAHQSQQPRENAVGGLDADPAAGQVLEPSGGLVGRHDQPRGHQHVEHRRGGRVEGGERAAVGQLDEQQPHGPGVRQHRCQGRIGAELEVGVVTAGEPHTGAQEPGHRHTVT